ncbi:MAG: diguanylate cyclase [Betaproteobacteria bacterium]|nr:diguanylate cyclase [Betaproteobacteria bacterium]
MRWFVLIPDTDAKQALRIRRYLMAVGGSFLVVFLLAAGYVQGLLELPVLLEATVVICALVALFYAVFRSGLNRLFPDPSLTMEQIIVSIMVVVFIMYQAERMRGVLLMVYVMPFLFGAFRLERVRLLLLVLLVLFAYAGTVLLSAYHRPGNVDAATEVTLFVALGTLLPWFAIMGRYIHSLRRRLYQSNRELRQALEKVHDISIHDELTGIYNRRFLMEALRREIARFDRSGSRFSVGLLDIDHFKRINDECGHATGDAVLQEFADLTQAGLRGGDMCGRFGGEEFMLLLPQTELEHAKVIAERLRLAIEQREFSGTRAPRRITATIGIAAYRAGEDTAQIIERADAAMYRGKAQGRNRVVSSED